MMQLPTRARSFHCPRALAAAATFVAQSCGDSPPKERVDLADAGVWIELDAGRDASVVNTPTLDAADGQDGSTEHGGSTEARDGSAATCENSLPLWQKPPETLSETGLYADIATKRVADSTMPFEPQFPLWSDGATKSRWMYLPECEGVINTSNMDAWSLPVGARAFKEFAVDGKRVETRFVHRYGAGPDDFLFGHYLWDDEESDARLITAETDPAALRHPKGTEYTVPTPDLCARCHGGGTSPGGLPARFLGFSAIQLSHTGLGATMHSLSAARRLTHPNRAGYAVPGTDGQRQALGYLHANCGHCHNHSADGVAFPASPFSLYLETSAQTVYDTRTYETAVGVEVAGYESTCSYRIYPGDPGLTYPPQGPVLSCAFERMSIRGDPTRQMPPLASHQVHPEGLAVLRDFIRGLGPAQEHHRGIRP